MYANPRRSTLLPSVVVAAVTATTAAAAAATLASLPAPAWGQPSPTAPALAAIPPPPAVPARLSFADEVAGRRALFSARDAYRTATSIQFKAQVRTLTQTGTARPTLTTATESVAAAPAGLRLNLTYETRAANARRVRRAAIANGESIVATRYEESAKAAPPVREVMRVPFVGDVRTLSAGLELLKVAPTSRAGILLLDPDWGVRGTAWRESAANGVETVNEVDAERGNERVRARTVRRYRIDARTRLLRTFEEWDTTTDLRGSGSEGRTSRSPRVTYRREEYGPSVATGKPLSGGLFAQAVPAGYREVAIPSGGDVEPAGPLEIDAKSAALLARWERAWDRFTSLNARLMLTTDAVGKTYDSRPVPDEWRNQQWQYAVQMRRPGRLYLTLSPVAASGGTAAAPDRGRGGGRRGESPVSAQTVVSDGQAVVVTGARNRRDRAVPVGPDPSLLGVRVRQAGYNDASETLDWLLFGPRSLYEDADAVVYKGQTSVDGATVDVVEITENVRAEQGGRRRRGSGDIESTLVTTVYLGADGLPRRTERYRTVRIQGGMLRDDPPDTLFVARYRDVVTDAPPAEATFRLPAVAGRTADRRERN